MTENEAVEGTHLEYTGGLHPGLGCQGNDKRDGGRYHREEPHENDWWCGLTYKFHRHKCTSWLSNRKES